MATVPLLPDEELDRWTGIAARLIGTYRGVWEGWEAAYNDAADQAAFIAENEASILNIQHRLRMMGVWLEPFWAESK